jgi:predicted TIM-barrel fold metal-dependent hydrolase
MIIDAHAHMGPLGQFSATADDLLHWADRAGIDKMVVSHLDAIFYDARAGNDALGMAIRAHPDRILGYASFTSAYFGQAAIDEIDRCVQDYGMRGLKIYSANKRSVAEPSMFPIVEHAAGRGLPILAHANAREIETLARQVPQATFIIAHVGEGMVDVNMWQTLSMARVCPNVILDLTSSQIYTGMVEACVAAAGAERVVFGTDVPLLEPEVQMHKARAANIDKRTRRLILGGNAARLFRLADEGEVNE